MVMREERGGRLQLNETRIHWERIYRLHLCESLGFAERTFYRPSLSCVAREIISFCTMDRLNLLIFIRWSSWQTNQYDWRFSALYWNNIYHVFNKRPMYLTLVCQQHTIILRSSIQVSCPAQFNFGDPTGTGASCVAMAVGNISHVQSENAWLKTTLRQYLPQPFISQSPANSFLPPILPILANGNTVKIQALNAPWASNFRAQPYGRIRRW